MKPLFLSLLILTMTAACGCQGLGLGTGAGEQIQGGTEAGNPPIDTPGYIGGTEAGNPPIGDNDGHGGEPHPYEGGQKCIGDETEDGENCKMLDPEGKSHLDATTIQHIEHSEEAQDGDHDHRAILFNPNAMRAIDRYVIDFGRNGPVDEDGKAMIASPFPNQAVLKNILPKP